MAKDDDEIIDGLDNPLLEQRFGSAYEQAGGEVELVQEAAPRFDEAAAKQAWSRTIAFFNRTLRG